MQMQSVRKWMLLLAAATAAQAQNHPVHAVIPFDFVVNGKTLPAGDYMVRSIVSGNALSLRSENNDIASSLTQPVHTIRAVEPKLVFHRYGKRYFLYQVWSIDPHDGWQLPQSRLEREYMARKEARSEVMVAMK